ncbi:HEXXH motif-containing putative peptide modification protein [Streptomyces sp. NBC_01381]|uniref:aKG-HExxH-type peptide beta-hydroxylase n=1 Tax=Streptomyces sp. NBC_01381 TaxID=2903845 RepID=UPI0022576AC5|nr:HEXXH motif-containing putative peptide modification protein [Streptomyces sp. NBC_01381]MCX4669901.1 HEXXH motif-containing putative peptide modification protein [Streptomyces sp. NBC_01381]
MTLAPVSSAVFAELARTRPLPTGTTALRAGLHTRRMVLLKALIARVDRMDPVVRRRFDRDWQVLEQAELARPAVVRDVLDYPMTGAWLAANLAAPDGPAFERHLTHFGAVAATAAVRAGCQVTMAVEVPSGLLALPGLGVLRCPAGRARLRIRAGLLRAEGGGIPGGTLLHVPPGGRPRGGGRGWSGLRDLPDDAVVLDDLDPYRVPASGIGPAALPAAERRQAPHRSWAERWRGARRLLLATDPGRVAEIGVVLRAVVPLGPGVRHGARQPMSATLRAAPGAVLAELPVSAEEMAEVLVHEAHHTKLAALQELVPLCERDGAAVHRVGWRPDPRPIAGVLQGAYAHLALTDLWRRAGAGTQTPRSWRRRSTEQFDAYRDQVESALSILLESDELTFEGREFTREMGRHHASLGRCSRLLG